VLNNGRLSVIYGADLINIMKPITDKNNKQAEYNNIKLLFFFSIISESDVTKVRIIPNIVNSLKEL